MITIRKKAETPALPKACDKERTLITPSKDDKCIAAMKRAKMMCMRYNKSKPFNLIQRNKIIKNLFGKIGVNFCIEPNFQCDYGYNIFAGDRLYINHNCVILDGAVITFGNDVFIGPNCGFYSAGHPFDRALRQAGLEYAQPITIGDDVWIGGNVSILPNVTIGSNVVIGAGSVVTCDIPDDCLAYGNPCRAVKSLK